jgi:outer membrane protein assembly factor BamB
MRPSPTPFLALLLSACSGLEPDVGPKNLCPSGVPASVPGYPSTGSAANASSTDAAAAGLSPAIYGSVSDNLLIADQYNNRVIEITREGSIVWSFGDGSNVPGPSSVVAPNDAERIPGGRTLIAGTGGPPNMDFTCPAAGCPDNRVIIVDDDSGTIVWQYGADQGGAGSGMDQLDVPVAAILVPTKGEEDILITDQGNNRVIEVSETTKHIRWQFPALGSKESLNNPNSAERLSTGNTLIADSGNGRVLEVEPSGAFKWVFPASSAGHQLSNPAFASRLPNGNTLITDAGTNEIIEVDGESPPNVVWAYSTTNRNPCDATPQPTSAVRLANEHTLITDQFNDQVLEVDHSPSPKLLYTYGKLGIGGSSIGLLNVPYDARVIGDYTGLTPPM